MRQLAVALHDVEPVTFERCALIRDWLTDLGVQRATLLVVPAPALHPFTDTSPELARWLSECVRAGDAVAQHGLEHPERRGRGGEFAGMCETDARRAILSGRRLLRLAGVEARGFVAPGYAYTSSLRAALRSTVDWWATVAGVHHRGTRTLHAPLLRPPLLGTCVLAGPLLRLDLHPADFARAGHVRSVERVLHRARGREAVTYDDLAAAL